MAAVDRLDAKNHYGEEKDVCFRCSRHLKDLNCSGCDKEPSLCTCIDIFADWDQEKKKEKTRQ